MSSKVGEVVMRRKPNQLTLACNLFTITAIEWKSPRGGRKAYAVLISMEYDGL